MEVGASGGMGEFPRDPGHWLRRFSPDEWIRAGLAEVAKAEAAYRSGDLRAGAAGLKRGAGMALNGALLVEPDEAWGRSYVDHLVALARDPRVPEAVREACRVVLDVKAPGSEVVVLRTPRTREVAVDAAKDVIAHAWAVVRRHDPEGGREDGPRLSCAGWCAGAVRVRPRRRTETAPASSACPALAS